MLNKLSLMMSLWQEHNACIHRLKLTQSEMAQLADLIITSGTHIDHF
ncbi:hypothetical protein [Pseudanabaena sp. FACHB-2040]|nr:hypothetical protein [Pseudanabaena sp. FACHB-2040]MBD2260957.1 hypothetical protein [Pseudanabaena sp. FACHB-2040]